MGRKSKNIRKNNKRKQKIKQKQTYKKQSVFVKSISSEVYLYGLKEIASDVFGKEYGDHLCPLNEKIKQK
jgi:hypothetical protein